MSIYLTDLAKWLRDVGLAVIEYDGWKTRARKSGGYAAMPLCVMWHHTASPKSWDGKKDADYCAVGNPYAPVSNLYIDRSGTVWVLAAGASNTNGEGKAITFSRGTVPQDGMNSRAVGVEMGNDGIGERWPRVQVDAMFAVSNIVNAKCGNRPDDIATHQFYAPNRKIDPATCNVEGPWVPKSCTSSGSWERADVQAECKRRAAPAPTPPDSEDDEMQVIYAFTQYTNTFSQNGVALSPEAFNALVAQGATVIMSNPHPQHLDSLLHLSGLTAEDLQPK